MVLTEAREISFMGFKIDPEEPTQQEKGDLAKPGQESVLFEPQIVRNPQKQQPEYQEFSAEFV